MEFFEILFAILVFVAIGKAAKKDNKAKRKQNGAQPMRNMQSQNMQSQNIQYQNAQLQERQRRAELQLQERQRLAEKQLQNRQRQTENTSIVDRARQNNQRFQQDTTLSEIEKMHSHSEMQASKPVEHSKVCQSHENYENVMEPAESMFGSVEDLMVKGYSGDMSFDRDFIGEAMDMISSFTL